MLASFTCFSVTGETEAVKIWLWTRFFNNKDRQ